MGQSQKKMNSRTALQLSRSIASKHQRLTSRVQPSTFIVTKRFKREFPENLDIDNVIEETKRGSHQSTIPEVPNWSEALASDSEANVKSDLAPKKPMRVLQEETIKIIEKKQVTKDQYPYMNNQ